MQPQQFFGIPFFDLKLYLLVRKKVRINLKIYGIPILSYLSEKDMGIIVI